MRATPQRPQPRPRVTPDPNFAPDSLPTVAATNRNTAKPISRRGLTVTKAFQKKIFSLTPFAPSLRNETATVVRGDGVTVGRRDSSTARRLDGSTARRLKNFFYARCAR